MFKIIEKTMLSKNICMMRIKAEKLSKFSEPGQFLIIRPDKKGERIPLTICDIDKTKGEVTIIFSLLGQSTKNMAKKNTNENFLDILGPLGHESEFIKEKKIGKFNNKKKYLFVGGGIGVAPIFPQIKWMKAEGLDVDVIIGAKTEKELILKKEIENLTKNLYISTDDGSCGTKGNVLTILKDLLKEKEYDEIITIGPLIMMKLVSNLTEKFKIKTTVSLNTLMIDGTGMCGACRVSIKDEIKFACVDGPEFDGHLIDYDEAMRRQLMYKTEEGKKILEKDDLEKNPNLNSGCGCKSNNSNSDSKIKNISEETELKNRFKRIHAKTQNPSTRSFNFNEVCLGYTAEEAYKESSRCLECKKAKCITGCPISIDIPGFIKNIKQYKMNAAVEKLHEFTSFPSVCGRVCPQESQCEKHCILGIKGEAVAIGKLEKFVGDYALRNNISINSKIKNKKEKVAIVGSGPAGLSAAAELAKMGYNVTIYEALHESGGVLQYGIPEFRLPKEKIVKKEIQKIKDLGVKIENNILIGRTKSIDYLLKEKMYSAVFIGSGAGLPKFLNIPGENANGVYSANEFLTRINLMNAHKRDYFTPIKLGSKVVVVGGGNVAIDAARTAKRLGANTHIVYRRGMEELPARIEEIEHAKEEGIIFNVFKNPKEILTDDAGNVKAIRCSKMKLGEIDKSGRRSPVEIKNSDFILEADSIIISIGTHSNDLLSSKTNDLKINKWNNLIVQDGTQLTTKKGVFAGGDAVTGSATVILAIAAGKKAALEIDKYIKDIKK